MDQNTFQRVPLVSTALKVFMEFSKVGTGQCSKDFTGFAERCTA